MAAPLSSITFNFQQNGFYHSCSDDLKSTIEGIILGIKSGFYYLARSADIDGCKTVTFCAKRKDFTTQKIEKYICALGIFQEAKNAKSLAEEPDETEDIFNEREELIEERRIQFTEAQEQLAQVSQETGIVHQFIP